MRAAFVLGAPGVPASPRHAVSVAELPVPVPGPSDVLVKVHSAALNPVDLLLIAGVRFAPPPADSKETDSAVQVLGVDCAGEVVAVGSACKRIKVGDKVWMMTSMDRIGTLAEFCVSDEKYVGLAPSSDALSLTSASCCPVVYLTSLQALRKLGAVDTPKTRGLIVGGSSGTGMAAIQLSRAYGASTVVAIASAKNAELVLSLGADDVIDYTSTADWSEVILKKYEDKFDWVYDTIGKAGTYKLAQKVLKPEGKFATIVVSSEKPTAEEIEKAKEGKIASHQVIFSQAGHEDLDVLKGLAEKGAVRPVIDGIYTLEEVSHGLTYLKTGHARGKVVVVLGGSDGGEDEDEEETYGE